MNRIGVIGHRRNIQLIEKTIRDYFGEIEVTHFDFNTMDQLDQTINYLKSQAKYLDGIFYTGKIPYDLINNVLNSNLPSVYIEHDQSKLQRTLLEASLNEGYDIKNTSIDSYDSASVFTTYHEFGLNRNQLNIHFSPYNIFDTDMLNKTYQFHKENLLEHCASFAITGISYVYEQLEKEGLPCLLIRPTDDAIKNTLSNLILQIHSIKNTVSQIVVISIEIDMPNEYNLVLENEYQLLLEKTHVSEEVYKFAQRIEAAVVETGTHNYMLFSTRKPLDSETNHLQSLPILKAIKDHTSHTISVGIGYGITARQAKYNASVALNKALKSGGNQAYIVNGNELQGPILVSKDENNDPPLIADSIYQVISDKTGISVNNIYRLHCIKEKLKKDHFTSLELASEFGTSPRSMNRIIEKLEVTDYISVEGTKIINGKGRPTRILKLLF